MYQIKTLNNISSKGMDLLDMSRYAVDSGSETVDGIILRSYKMHDMEIPEGLKGVARAGAGTNNIPVNEYTPKKVSLSSTLPEQTQTALKNSCLWDFSISSRKIIRGVDWVQSLDKGDERFKAC